MGAGTWPAVDLRRAIADSLAHRRRRGAAQAADAAPAPAPARAAVRRQRIDGALLAHAAALRPRRDEASPPRRDLSLLDAADPDHEAAPRVRADVALAAVSRSVPDWSGGTRIGGAVREFHQRWGRRVLRGGPVVLLVSDGWDRGDPGSCGDRDRAAPAQLPSPGVAEPAHRHGRLRAVDARPPGGAAVRRRLPAGADLDQSRRPRATLERAGLTGAKDSHGHLRHLYLRRAARSGVGSADGSRRHCRRAFPGCTRFEPDGDDRYDVTLTVGLAAITGTYNGTVMLTDKIRPRRTVWWWRDRDGLDS